MSVKNVRIKISVHRQFEIIKEWADKNDFEMDITYNSKIKQLSIRFDEKRIGYCNYCEDNKCNSSENCKALSFTKMDISSFLEKYNNPSEKKPFKEKVFGVSTPAKKEAFKIGDEVWVKLVIVEDIDKDGDYELSKSDDQGFIYMKENEIFKSLPTELKEDIPDNEFFEDQKPAGFKELSMMQDSLSEDEIYLDEMILKNRI